MLNWLQANKMFWEAGLFSSPGGNGGEAAAQLGLTEIALLDQWAACVIYHLLYMHVGLHFFMVGGVKCAIRVVNSMKA